jgi:uncharacterized surface protein with fasciclin (FAS1) repeats
MSKHVSKKTVAISSLVLTIFLGFGCTQDGNGRISPGLQTIYQTSATTADLETFNKAVQDAGLVAMLNGIGPYTVFAPSNKAFDEAPGGLSALMADKQKLAGVLKHGIVNQVIYAKEAAKLNQITAIDGTNLNLGTAAVLGTWKEGAGRYYNWHRTPQRQKFEYLTVDGAGVIKPDIMCSNGVIYIIDKVLMP